MSCEERLAQAYATISTAETGRATSGHRCLSSQEQASAAKLETGLLTYGELLPTGVTKLFGPECLDVSNNASTLLDLGMGTGKVLMQAFLGPSWGNLKTLVGVEMAASRYLLSEDAARRLVEQSRPVRGGEAGAEDNELFITIDEPGVRIQITDKAARTLEFRCGDLFKHVTVAELAAAEVVVIETCLPPVAFAPLAELLLRRATHRDARVVLYHDLKLLWAALIANGGCDGDDSGDSEGVAKGSGRRAAGQPRLPPLCPYHPLNGEDDLFATSWAPDAGFHFFCYRRDDSCEPSLKHFPTSMVSHLIATDTFRRALVPLAPPPLPPLPPTGERESSTDDDAGDASSRERCEVREAVERGGEAALALALKLAEQTPQQPLQGDSFPAGSKVGVACFVLPTDFLFPETYLGDWSPGWVLGRHNTCDGGGVRDNKGCADGESYIVVTEDGEVDEDVHRLCLRLRL